LETKKEVRLEKQTLRGRVICVVTSIVYLLLFAICAAPIADGGMVGMQVMAQGIAILFASVIVLIVSIVASSLLYANDCPARFYWIPSALLLFWILFFAPLFIEKPYYWGGVSFQNKSSSDIWVEHEGLVEKNANPGSSGSNQIGGSGVNWGNSPDSITVVWWYGSSRVPPFDKSQINRMVMIPPANLSRGTSLLVEIDENGEWSIDSYPPTRKKSPGPRPFREYQ